MSDFKMAIRVLFALIVLLCLPLEMVCQSNMRIYEDYSGFENEVLGKKSKNLHIINIWATWCKPCEEELPMIIDYVQSEDCANCDYTFVSLDFEKDIESKLIPMVKRLGIEDHTVVLLDGNSSEWIPKVDPSWSGALPFTMVVRREERSAHEGKLDNRSDLEEIIRAVDTKH